MREFYGCLQTIAGEEARKGIPPRKKKDPPQRRRDAEHTKCGQGPSYRNRPRLYWAWTARYR